MNCDELSVVWTDSVVAGSTGGAAPGGIMQVSTSSALQASASTAQRSLAEAMEVPHTLLPYATDDAIKCRVFEQHPCTCAPTGIPPVENAMQESILGCSDRKDNDVLQDEGVDESNVTHQTLGSASVLPLSRATAVASRNRGYDKNGIATEVALPASGRCSSNFSNKLESLPPDVDQLSLDTVLSPSSQYFRTASPNAAATTPTRALESLAMSVVPSKRALNTCDHASGTTRVDFAPSSPPPMPHHTSGTQFWSMSEISEAALHEMPLPPVGTLANSLTTASSVTASSTSGSAASPVNVDTRSTIPVPAAFTGARKVPLISPTAAMPPSDQCIAGLHMPAKRREGSDAQSCFQMAARAKEDHNSGSARIDGNTLFDSLESSPTCSAKKRTDDSFSSSETSPSQRWSASPEGHTRIPVFMHVTTPTKQTTGELHPSPLTDMCVPLEEVTVAQQRSTPIFPDGVAVTNTNVKTSIQNPQELCTHLELPMLISGTYQSPPSPTVHGSTPTTQQLPTQPSAVWYKKLNDSRSIPSPPQARLRQPTLGEAAEAPERDSLYSYSSRQHQSNHNFPLKNSASLPANNAVVRSDLYNSRTTHSSMTDGSISLEQNSMSSDHIMHTLIHGMALGEASSELWKTTHDSLTPPLRTSHLTNSANHWSTSRCTWLQPPHPERHWHCVVGEADGDLQGLWNLMAQGSSTLPSRSATSNIIGVHHGIEDKSKRSTSSSSCLPLTLRLCEAEMPPHLGRSVPLTSPRGMSRTVELAASPTCFSGSEEKKSRLGEMSPARLGGADKGGATHNLTTTYEHRGLHDWGYLRTTPEGSLRLTTSFGAITPPAWCGEAHHVDGSSAVTMQQDGLEQHRFSAQPGSADHRNPSLLPLVLVGTMRSHSFVVKSSEPSRTRLVREEAISPASTTPNETDSGQICVPARSPMTLTAPPQRRFSRGILSTDHRGVTAVVPVRTFPEAPYTFADSMADVGAFAAHLAAVPTSTSPPPTRTGCARSGTVDTFHFIEEWIPAMADAKDSAALSCLKREATQHVPTPATEVPLGYAFPSPNISQVPTQAHSTTQERFSAYHKPLLAPLLPPPQGILKAVGTPSAGPDKDAEHMLLPVLPLAQEEIEATSTSYEAQTPKVMSPTPANSSTENTLILVYPVQQAPLQFRTVTSSAVQSFLQDQHNSIFCARQISDNHCTSAALHRGLAQESSSRIIYRADNAGAGGGRESGHIFGTNRRMLVHSRGAIARNNSRDHRNGGRGDCADTLVRISIPCYQRYRDVEAMLDDAERAINTATVPIISVLGHCGESPNGKECLFEAIGNRPSLSILSLETAVWTASIASSDMGPVLASARGSTADKSEASPTGIKSSHCVSAQRTQLREQRGAQ